MMFLGIRVVSMLLALAAFTLLSKLDFQVALVSLLYGHYALSFYYSKDQFVRLGRERMTWIPLAVLALLSGAYIWSGLYVLAFVPFVGFHIALSETYMINQAHSAHVVHPPETLWHMNVSRFFTSASLFVLLLNDHPIFRTVPIPVLHGVVIVSFLYFFWKLPKANDKFTTAMRRDYLLFELSGLAGAYFLLALNLPISFQLFVFYHVMTWIIYPALTFGRRPDKRALRVFGVHTVLSTLAVFVVTSPLLMKDYALDLKSVIPLWGTLHFVTSFPLSRLNPRLLTRFFYPEKAT